MNPFLMQQKNIPTISELWKNEVNKYRLWIIMFFIGGITILILSLIAIILNSIEFQSGVHAYLSILNKSIPKSQPNITYSQAKTYYIMTIIIIPLIMFLLLLASLIMIGVSIIQAYKTKNFARISGTGLFIIKFITFIAIINIFYWIFFSGGMNILQGIPGALYSFIVMFVYIPMAYFSHRISKIRNLFLIAERMEKLKNNPNFQNMQEQMQQFFGNFANMQSGNSSQPFNNKSKNQNTNFSSSTKSQTIKKTTTTNSKSSSKNISTSDWELSKLNITQLRTIAKKLYISGHEKMNKKELISFIKRATSKK